VADVVGLDAADVVLLNQVPVALGDRVVRTAAERDLQLAIQAAIGVAVHILAEDSTGTPEEYGSAFLAIADLGVIDPELATRLKSAAGLRDVLVHDYLAVDSLLVWDGIEHLDDLLTFTSAIERYLE